MTLLDDLLAQATPQRGPAYVEGDCLIWHGAKPTAKGYGRVKRAGKRYYVHRLAWIERHGEPPAETPYVLHRCDARLCIADGHHFLGTHEDNAADMLAKRRHHNHAKTECIRHHAFTEANTYTNPRNGSRHCKTCSRLRDAEARMERKNKK